MDALIIGISIAMAYIVIGLAVIATVDLLVKGNLWRWCLEYPIGRKAYLVLIWPAVLAAYFWRGRHED